MQTPASHAAPGTPATAGRPEAPAAGLLGEITAGLAAGSDLDALLQRFLEPIVRLAGAQAGAVRVLSEDGEHGEQLQLVSSLGLPAELSGTEQAVDRHCGHCGAAADGQALVWASDLKACSAQPGGEYFGHGCQRLLAVPLRHRGRTLGVYNLFFAATDEPSAQVQALLKSIGELLGLALNNARLEQAHLRHSLRDERQRMAAEVHDSVAQSLAFVRMRMPLLHDAMRAHDEPRSQQYYDDVRAAVSQAHASLRGILSDFRAPMDPRGLQQALADCAEDFRRRSTTALQVDNDLPALTLAPEQEAQVFHIVQEALNNIARHAGARQAWLRIAPAGAGETRIDIEDDGAGLPAEGAPGGSHYGLEIMAERARRLGGRLELGPRPGGGTRLRLSIAAAATAPAATSAATTVRGA